ncbi:bifunctional riboflavin kinase/FAD synthetase [Gilvimarinus sp. SDUM040013]|uniref:Riboflavin biosynthesis protein n=1 Tax=Gilvimarinus gilvus TaxID=3058038 RepID=A0ABU4S0X7_9GAMM|nr:bifunctional riboflavin kinase/FAD synthetase [Gilvimarinus sp. SDUM040013]MDO3384890.1 bifunctional riboflavin kinase/FAD synthetase [Gilvimarinus sp. SDUM040013]MDX6850685.1 bifunctional riboflavin kinase/FAD synthetase [Gilvimarinus sp. SDUM040013]
MQLIRGLHNLRPDHRGSVATIGTFDGVHLGHQAILRQLDDAARDMGLPSVVILFEPQPHEYFARDKAPARLMRLREKLQALAAAGVERVLCLNFNEDLRSLTAEQFVNRILVDGLGIQHLVVGDDFRFGCDRAGDFRLLQAMGLEQGFSVTDTCTLMMGPERISSTRIRELLASGDFVKAEACLGQPFCIAGRVGHGRKLGREIGVPTANIRLQRYCSPLSGVFVISADIAGETFAGVANVGIKPTVGGEPEPLLEVHLFDFERDIYGVAVIIRFHAKLRDEHKFASLDALKAQLQDDIHRGRAFIAGVDINTD